MAQGSNRRERGEQFFRTASAVARAGHARFNWQLKSVAGVAHSNSGMAREALLAATPPGS